MGIIGTVMGLVHILGNMSDAASLAPAIASAFIVTLYGVCFANLVYLPLAGKLKLKTKRENVEREFVIEGILSIQAGENTSMLEEKLSGFLLEQEKSNISSGEV